LFELMSAINKQKWRIAGAAAVVGVVAFCISLALPDFYKASTKLLPPQQAQSGTAAILSQLGGGSGLAAGMAGLKNPNDMYIGMLKSRTVADKLIAKFDLKTAYETKSQEDARRILANNSLITSGKDGIITIEVEGKDRGAVAKLANAYTAELLDLAGKLALTEASQRRVFFERQLETSKDKLAQAEVLLKKAMQTSGIVSVDGESRAIIETVVRLQAQISAKEIQRDSIRAFLTENHPDFKRVEEELKSQRAELSRLENGRKKDPLSQETQQAGLGNIKLVRDVKYNQMLYELLSKQYEVARIDEAQEPSIIQVLDAAVDPERKFKPARALIAILASILTVLGAIAWIFFVEVRRTVQKPSGEIRTAQ